MNENKTASVCSKGVYVSYLDTKKTSFIPFTIKEKSPLPQTKGKLSVSRFTYNERIHLSPKQLLMFRECLYGEKAYTSEEFSLLEPKQQSKIKSKNHLVQKYINIWKNEITEDVVDEFLISVFKKSMFIKGFSTMKSANENTDFLSTFEFKELGISQKALIEKFMEWHFLPQNFLHNELV